MPAVASEPKIAPPLPPAPAPSRRPAGDDQGDSGFASLLDQSSAPQDDPAPQPKQRNNGGDEHEASAPGGNNRAVPHTKAPNRTQKTRSASRPTAEKRTPDKTAGKSAGKETKKSDDTQAPAGTPVTVEAAPQPKVQAVTSSETTTGEKTGQETQAAVVVEVPGTIKAPAASGAPADEKSTESKSDTKEGEKSTAGIPADVAADAVDAASAPQPSNGEPNVAVASVVPAQPAANIDQNAPAAGNEGSPVLSPTGTPAIDAPKDPPQQINGEAPDKTDGKVGQPGQASNLAPVETAEAPAPKLPSIDPSKFAQHPVVAGGKKAGEKTTVTSEAQLKSHADADKSIKQAHAAETPAKIANDNNDDAAKPAKTGDADATPKNDKPAVEHTVRVAEPTVSPPNGANTIKLTVDAAQPLAQIQPPQNVAAPAQPVAPTPQAAPIPLDALAVDIAAKAQAGNNRFEIRLDPPELGRIDVRLNVDRDGHVTSRLVVERAETLDLLRRDAPQLERALQDAGLKTSDNGLQFSLRQQAPDQHDAPLPAKDNARLIVTDNLPASDLTQRGYSRLAELRGGVDIRV